MIAPGLTLPADERRLLDRAAASPGATLGELNAAALARLTATEGIDFATALFYDRLRCAPGNRPFIEQLEARCDPTGDGPSPSVVIVPGAFHREAPASGADGRRIREAAGRLGCSTALVPLRSLAPLAECGRQICAALLAHRGPPMVLVSLSKGGADVRAALNCPNADAAFERVAVWISVSGIIHGTPLVGWLRRRRLRTLLVRALFRLRGYPFAVLDELDHRPDDAAPRLPPHLQIIHVAGFPLRRHVASRRLRRGHRRLTPFGPNDGVALLADLCRLPGIVYPVWGTDHFLQRAGCDIGNLIARVLRVAGCLVTP